MVLNLQTKINIICNKKTFKYIFLTFGLSSMIFICSRPELKTYLFEILGNLHNYGYSSLFILFPMYILFNAPTFLPTNILHITCGLIFGLAKGVIFSLLMYTVSATIPFYLVKKYFNEKARNMLEDTKIYSLLDIIEEKPFIILICCRISPVVPGSLENMLFGITSISTYLYMLGTTIGITPQLILLVYIGTIIQNITEVGEINLFHNPFNLALFIIGLFLTILMFSVIIYKANKIINQEKSYLPA